MGRSKQTASPSLKPHTPLNATPKGHNATPGKSGTKRPLPQESDSEEENHELLPQNGFLKTKKGKFTMPEGDVSDDDVSAEVSESSEDEDEVDSDVNEEDQDEDESEEEDEDDDDDEDEDTDEDEPVQSNALSKVASKPIDAAPQARETDKAEKPTSKSTGPVTHFLIPNPPRDLAQLKKILGDRGYPVEHLEPMNIRVALATVPASKDPKNLVTGDKALSVDGKTVHFIRLEGSSDALALLGPETSETLFISGIPKFVTMEMLLSKLPNGCKPVSNKLLDRGRRNQHFNAAFLEFSSKSDSAAAFNALMNVKFADRKIVVAYSHSREGPSAPNADTTTSGRQYQIRVLNAPVDTTTDQILPLFPGATKAHRSNMGHFFLDFPDEATLRKAATGQKVFKKNILRVSVPGGLDGNVMLIRNIPFEASESELRTVYPEATKITLHRRPDGAFNGSAVIEFASAASAQSAVQRNVTIKGRRLFGIPSFVELSAGKQPGTVKQPKVDQTTPKSKKAELPQVGSASEEEDESAEEVQTKKLGVTKVAASKSKEESASEDEDEDEDDNDDDEDEDSDEEEEEDESAGSEDEGIEDASDEEMPIEKSRDKGNFTPSKKHFGNPDKKERGSHWGDGRGSSPRGGRGFGDRGRGGSNHRGHDGGFKHRGGRGGGDRGRGRGSFHRGRGFNRGKRG